MRNSLTFLGAAAIIALGLYFGLRERSAPSASPPNPAPATADSPAPQTSVTAVQTPAGRTEPGEPAAAEEARPSVPPATDRPTSRTGDNSTAEQKTQLREPRTSGQKKESAEAYRVVTSDDGLSCEFSQDLSVSLGTPTSGTARGSANHFRCIDKAKKEVEIDLVSAGLENGKVAIRTKRFGTVYRGDEPGKFSTYEMTDSQIKQLKNLLGLPGGDQQPQSSPNPPKGAAELSPSGSRSPSEERYEKVDPKDLYIIFEAAMKRLDVDSDDRIIEIEGDVKTLRIGATDIELLTATITTEGGRAVIATKKYGKIQYSSNSNAQATFWLTPSQKRQLRSLMVPK